MRSADVLLHLASDSRLPTLLADASAVTESSALLSTTAAAIRRHDLLQECSTASSLKAKDAGRAATDAWIAKVSALVSSAVAESRWAGLCLLGVTCQECSRQRFLECYNSWFMTALLSLKQQTEPVFVRAAAFASLTDIIVRLGGLAEVAGVRRDGASLISKLIQPLLQLIGDKNSKFLLDEALDLLIAILKNFSNCLRHQAINVEVLLVARFTDVNCLSSVGEKCAKALALVPKAHGDAASWGSLMRRVLIAINADLDFAFRGMEDASVAEVATQALLPQGQDPPRPLGEDPSKQLGGQSSAGIQPGKNLWRQLLPRISYLLQCCNYLLICPYPTPVSAPVGPLLSLVMRILRVDGSISSSVLGSSVFSSQHVSVCLELPSLHLSALELLAAALRGVRGQLLPRGAALVRLLTDHFRRFEGSYSNLRVQLYAISRHLFIAMGAGITSALAPAVVGSALMDLKGSSSREHLPPSNVAKASGVSSGSQGSKNSKKRKEAGGMPGDHSINVLGAVANIEEEGRAPPAVQVAALQALEALLNTGGALLPERWRAEVDAALAGVAIGVAADTTSFNLSCDKDTSHFRNLGAKSVDMRVAAYQALLASLLAPCGHRPPHLAQGLALFRNGRKEVGTEVATVCARALMALEPLIHPRCLPPAITFTEMARERNINGTSSYFQKTNKSEHPSFGGSSMKIRNLSTDPWAEVETWLGYGDDTGDNVISHPERSHALPDGVANGSLVAERPPSANGGLDDLAADRATSAHIDEARPISPTEPSKNELVEDPMQIETEAAAPVNNSLVRDSPNDSLSKQEVGAQTPSAINIAEPSSQGAKLQNLQPASDLVTIGTDIMASTSANTAAPDSQVSASVIASETVVVEVTTSTLSAAEDIVTFPKVAHQAAAADSDSDGPLPDIVDGDPDPDSD